MQCQRCGSPNVAEANFCSACGQSIQQQDPADTTMSFLPESHADAGGNDDLIPAVELEGGKAVLIVKKGPDAGAKFLLDKDLITCGRASSCDIFLDDVTVSRKHALIRREDQRFAISDWGSLNGTFLNRNRVDTAPLVNGDEIQIGKFRLVFFTDDGAGP